MPARRTHVPAPGAPKNFGDLITDPAELEAEIARKEAADVAERDADNQVTPDDAAAMEADGQPDSGTLTDPDAQPADDSKPKRTRRKYERKVIKEITDLDALDAEDVPEEEWESHPLTDTGAIRSPAQMKIDAQVKSLFDEWVEKGRPDARHSPRKRLKVSPEDAPAIRFLIGQAGKLHDVLPKFSPVAHDQDGREVVVYSVSARVKRPRNKDVPAPDASEQPVSTNTPADDAGNDSPDE
jgi:hypothetical protein